MFDTMLNQDTLPALPHARMEGAGVTDAETAARIAQAHAREVWGHTVALDAPLHIADTAGSLWAYAFPVAIGVAAFPTHDTIFQAVRDARTAAGDETDAVPLSDGIEERLGRFGTVYISATQDDFPVLRVSHYLHPYFTHGELAQAVADTHFELGRSRLDRITFAGPADERFEFVLDGKRLLLSLHTLELVEEAPEMEAAEPFMPEPALREEIERAWRRFDTPVPMATTPVLRRVPHWNRIPVVNWTWWCVPTALSMVIGYWDNHAHGGGQAGYGRLISHWFDHPRFPTDMTQPRNNVPSFIDEVIDPATGTWRAGFADFDDFVQQTYGYTFHKTDVMANAGNDFGWHVLKQEIDLGRPAIWATLVPNHALTAYGYRVTSNGDRFVLVLTTWGTTWQQQAEEWQYARCRSVGRIVPGGATVGEHLIINEPDGGERLTETAPVAIEWTVWGHQIQRTTLEFSADGGNTWTTIAQNVPTHEGRNAYMWVPSQRTARGRVRVRGSRTNGTYIAGDGSQHNFRIVRNPHNVWGKWHSLGRPQEAGTPFDLQTLTLGRNADGRLELFAISDAGALWHRYQTQPNGTWTGWGSMGYPAATNRLRPMITIGTHTDGRMALFALGDDHAVWMRAQHQPNTHWTNWASIGKPGAQHDLFRLSASRFADGRLGVFALSKSDHAVWLRIQHPNGAWGAWQSLGKPTGTYSLYTLAVAPNADGRLELFAGGGVRSGEFGLSNCAVWRRRQSAGQTGWSNWATLGTPTTMSAAPYPVVERNQDGRLELFTVAADGAIWHCWQLAPNGTWGGWVSRGVPPGGRHFLSMPATGRNADGRIELVGVGLRLENGRLVSSPWHAWQTRANGPWHGWVRLGLLPGRSIEQVAMHAHKDGRLALVALTSEDKAAWHIWQRA